jgi:hypothetical protein
VLEDLKRRERMALSANILIGIGSAVALASAATFIFGWKHFTIRPQAKPPAANHDEQAATMQKQDIGCVSETVSWGVGGVQW